MFDLVNKQGLIAHSRLPAGQVHELDWGGAYDKAANMDPVARAKERDQRFKARASAIAKELGISTKEVIRRKLHIKKI